MKKIVFLLIFGFSICQIKAQELEVLGQMILPKDYEASVAFQSFGSLPLGESSFGIWTFIWVQPVYDYTEIVLGVNKSFEIDELYLEAGLGLGAEFYEGTYLRHAGYLYAEKNSFSAEFYGENGGLASTGFWHMSHITHQINKNFSGGFYSQTESGLGGRVILTLLPQSIAPISIWGNLSSRGAIVGLQVNL